MAYIRRVRTKTRPFDVGPLSISPSTLETRAYLTRFHFQYLQRETLPIGLLFYDKLFVDCDLQNLRWTENDRWSFEKQGQPWPTEVEMRDHDYSFPEIALKEYLGHNPMVFAALRKRLEYVRATDSEYNPFFKETFEIPLQELERVGRGGALILSLTVLQRMFEMWEAWNLPLGRDLDHVDEQNLLAIYYDIFVTTFLSRTYSIAPLMTYTELKVIKELLSGPDIPLWQKGESGPLCDLFPFDTLHQMLTANQFPAKSVALSLQGMTVPDFAQIPLPELARFIEKDKSAPICRLISELMVKYGRGIKEQDIIAEVAGQLLKVAKVLWPSISNVVIGVAGNIPVPFVNPVGLLGSAKQITIKRDLEKDYPWVLALQELREMSEP